MLALTTGGTKLEAQGKMITIYPSDQSFANLKDYAEKLSADLKENKYPIVRWDYRFKDTNVFFRYGAFLAEYLPDSMGYLKPAINYEGKKY